MKLTELKNLLQECQSGESLQFFLQNDYPEKMTIKQFLFTLRNTHAPNMCDKDLYDLLRKTVDTFIELEQKKPESASIIENIFEILQDAMFFGNEINQFLKINLNFIDSVLLMFEHLKTFNRLNKIELRTLPDKESLRGFVKFISLCFIQKINITWELFEKIKRQYSYTHFFLGLEKIFDTHPDWLNDEMLELILTRYNRSKLKAILALNKGNFLDEKKLAICFSNENIDVIVNCLEETHLLISNQIFIDRLFNAEIVKEEQNNLCLVLDYLNRVGHLSTEWLYKCLIDVYVVSRGSEPNGYMELFLLLDRLKLSFDSDDFDELSSMRTSNLFLFLKSVKKAEIESLVNKQVIPIELVRLLLVLHLSNDNFDFNDFEDEFYDRISSLSSLTLMRVVELLRLAQKGNLLNANDFLTIIDRIIKRVTAQVPNAKESKVNIEKISRKISNESRSNIRVGSKFSFFVEHQANKITYLHGGGGIIKKGFETITDNLPKYAIKSLTGDNLEESEKEAHREVKYHQLLDRKAFYFNKKKSVGVCMEWFPDKILADFTPHELTQISFQEKISCIISLLTEIDCLHKHYRVHGDIKPQNVILNMQNLTMKLIDFGSTRKPNSSKTFAYTRNFCDRTDEWKEHYHFCDDIYSTAIVMGHLFSELFEFTYGGYDVGSYLSRRKEESTCSFQEKAMYMLISRMQCSTRIERCTSKDVLQFCKALASATHLDKVKLSEIAKSTIHRTETSLSDVLRGAIKRR